MELWEISKLNFNKSQSSLRLSMIKKIVNLMSFMNSIFKENRSWKMKKTS